jgi:hypothetical protein
MLQKLQAEMRRTRNGMTAAIVPVAGEHPGSSDGATRDTRACMHTRTVVFTHSFRPARTRTSAHAQTPHA